MIKLLLIWTIGLLPAIIFSQPQSNQRNTVETRQRNMTNVNKVETGKKVFNNGYDSIPYRLVYPEKQMQTEKYPLLVYLHGMGTRGKDNEKPLEKFSVFFS